MNPTRRHVIIPYRVFEEYVTTDIVFPCFVWHGGDSYSYVLPEVEVVADVKVDKRQKSLYQISPRARYNMVAVPASAIPQDAIRMYMPRVESLKQMAEISANQNLPDPIQGKDRSFVNNNSHKVKKGETIEMLSKMYGVKEEHLKEINNYREPREGDYYNVFPEIYFGADPYKLGYRNDNELSGVGTIYEASSLMEMVTNFLMGGELGVKDIRNRNMIITGNAREQVKNWDEVQILVEINKNRLIEQGLKAGEIVTYEKHITSLIKLNIFENYVTESIQEKTKAVFGYPNKARDFWSPVHFIGSFNMSMRVNSDEQTATVAVYDSKTISSLTDNFLSSEINKSDGRFLRNTYQRYVWTIRLK